MCALSGDDRELLRKYQSAVDELIFRCVETKEDLIYSTISKYLEEELENCIVSKRLLIRALETFELEHAEEYKELQEKTTARNEVTR